MFFYYCYLGEAADINVQLLTQTAREGREESNKILHVYKQGGKT